MDHSEKKVRLVAKSYIVIKKKVLIMKRPLHIWIY